MVENILGNNALKKLGLSLVTLMLISCDGLPKTQPNYPDELAEKYEKTGGSMLGSPGFKLFDDQSQKPDEGGGGVAVNAYLWRATLDTLSFLPLAQVDAFGGVIITDWHSVDENSKERLKVNAYILGRELRANGIRISVFKQILNQQGAWVDAKVAEDVATKLEDAVLTKARQLRIAMKAPQK